MALGFSSRNASPNADYCFRQDAWHYIHRISRMTRLIPNCQSLPDSFARLPRYLADERPSKLMAVDYGTAQHAWSAI
jgi:hypothetical protein